MAAIKIDMLLTIMDTAHDWWSILNLGNDSDTKDNPT